MVRSCYDECCVTNNNYMVTGLNFLPETLKNCNLVASTSSLFSLYIYTVGKKTRGAELEVDNNWASAKVYSRKLLLGEGEYS